jgi:hypothetical protein
MPKSTANARPCAQVQDGRRSSQASGGTAHGKVVRKVTHTMHIKGHKVAATPDDPQILVETEDGARAAHKPEALHKD